METLGTIEQTKDYEQFVILGANREVSKSHINKLVKVFRDNPRASEYRPVLVNENMEVIDGQHRLYALMELGYPIFYTTVRGLTIDDTQQMNAYQRNWSPIDYAKSYATLGNTEYKRFLYFFNKYLFTYRTTMLYMLGKISMGAESRFRTGGFSTEAPDEVLNIRFTMLEDVVNEIHAQIKGFTRTDAAFARAFLAMLMRPDYDHDFFLHKLNLFCAKFITPKAGVVDYQRQLESVWNERTADEKRIRLF